MSSTIQRTPLKDRHPFWLAMTPREQYEYLRKEYPSYPSIAIAKALGMDLTFLSKEEEISQTKSKKLRKMQLENLNNLHEMVEKMPVGYQPACAYAHIPRVIGDIPDDVDRSDLNDFPISGKLCL